MTNPVYNTARSIDIALRTLLVYYYWGVLSRILKYAPIALVLFLALAYNDGGKYLQYLLGPLVVIAITSAFATLMVLLEEAARYNHHRAYPA